MNCQLLVALPAAHLKCMEILKQTSACLVQTAAAQASADILELVDLILLAVEGGCLVPLAIVYMYWVRRAVASDRVSLYSIFLRVPRPTVVAIAKAEVRLVGEDADDDDEPAVCMLTCKGCHQVGSAHLPPQK